ncbi:hypothetical protein VSS37_03990 [Candidatus Thiothrix sp. Deng01]|uniref:Uncharacterized protein n=1 Tax=Candidatus Thiothrix phosphatis TaxID=3112415 RepID=A0ABU6CVQ1_9GAMM|nr:hypothetical protein [Candidatus Thiothrix sp. Deng01]MEB4590133.1 hypothetical protein [Candidatus Thiothrix sp. Deng01]
MESIVNEARALRVIFQNVDTACSELHKPQPRSKKGAGSERVCQGNAQWLDGLELPVPVLDSASGYATYYLMLAQDGAVELSRPVVRKGKFDAYIERLFLLSGDDPLDSGSFDGQSTETGGQWDIEPEVTRKK